MSVLLKGGKVVILAVVLFGGWLLAATLGTAAYVAGNPESSNG